MAVKMAVRVRRFGDDHDNEAIEFPAAGVADLRFGTSPVQDDKRLHLGIDIGDVEKGPRVGMVYWPPSTPEEMVEAPSLGRPHSHPSDNLRIEIKGALVMGRDVIRPGAFRMHRASSPYGSEGAARHVDGNWLVLCFADKRGCRPRYSNRALRAEKETEELVQREREITGVDVLRPNDPGVQGFVTTLTTSWGRGQYIDASLDESGDWPGLANGVRVCVSLMGDHEVGPIYIIQRTPPGAVATPAMTVGSDVFRCVVSGSGERDGQVLSAGDARVQAAGVPWGEVTAGPTGLDEVIIIGDRRGRRVDVDQADIEWPNQIDQLVTGLLPELDKLTDDLAVADN